MAYAILSQRYERAEGEGEGEGKEEGEGEDQNIGLQQRV